MVLFRMCVRANKLLFASGIGLQALIFLVATDSEQHLHVINGDKGSKLGDLSNLNKPLSQVQEHECFLDNVTGDIYYYMSDNQWVSKGNVGIHSRIQAESFNTIGKFVTKVPQYRPKTATGNMLMTSTNQENICYLKKQHLQHYLFASVSPQFVVQSRNNWDVHSFNFVNPNKKFVTLAESEKGPMVIQLSDNIVGTQFTISAKYQDTFQIIQNYIKHQLIKIKCGQYVQKPIVEATVQIMEKLDAQTEKNNQGQ